ncbi:MAG: HAD hydrolase-like protein, partial [Nanoarchaeota archaeon]
MLLVFDLDDTLYGCTGQMKEATKWEDARRIVPFSGVIELLSSFPAEKILLSRETDAGLQDIKIDALGIRAYFSKIYLCRKNDEKRGLLEIIKGDYSSEDIWVVGDRIDAEIQYGNELGMKTVRLRH